MPKAVLVGQDFAGCYGLDVLGHQLEARGYLVKRALGFGKQLEVSLDSIRAAVSRASFVVTGRSSSNDLALPEIAALEAGFKACVPCFMYSDGWVSLLPWFAGAYVKLACLFVAHKYCAKQVRRVFPDIRVIVSGNPEWEEFFPGPDYEQQRTGMRGRLEQLGAPSDTSFILVPGSKDLRLNLELWRDVGQAASMVGGNLCLLASMHPGDRNDPDAYRQELSSTVKAPLVFASKEKTGETKELVPVSDYIISSFSTIGDRAACQGKRVINYVSPDALNFLMAQNALLPVSERGIWPPCRAGASRLVFGGAQELAKAIQEMMSPERFSCYRMAQEQLYGKQRLSPGTAASVMADEIESALKVLRP